MDNKVVVIGGAGFIGAHTVVALAQAGYQPVIIDNMCNSTPKILEGIAHILGNSIPHYHIDATDAAKLAACISKENPAGAIHFAAHKNVEESTKQPLKYYQNNLGTLLALLRTGIQRIVFSSSCTVYGTEVPQIIPEDTPLGTTTSPYARTKQMCEQMLQDHCLSGRTQNISQSISLRYFNPIGAHPSGHIGELSAGSNLVPALLRAAHKNHIASVFGNDYDTPDGTCVRDYLHVMDLASMHLNAWMQLERLNEALAPNSTPQPYYEVFNCGTGQGISVLELIEAFNTATGESVRPIIQQRRAGDVAQSVAAIQKSQRHGIHVQKYTLVDALAHAWQWSNSTS